MHTIIKNVISRGEFSLPDIEKKIDKLWSESKISDTERDELINLARAKATPKGNIDIYTLVLSLESRVKALEMGGNKSAEDNPPEWKLGDIHNRGDRVTFDGKIYKCIAPQGFPCCWAPYGEHGYPPYWEAE